MPDPLHPAIVHFPIVLAVLAPIVIGLVLLDGWGRAKKRVWLAATALCVALASSAWVATETGESDEDPVEEIVGDSVLHEHEEAGERVLFGAAVLAALAVAGLIPGRVGTTSRVLAGVASVAVAALAYQAGHSGGEMVYTHGAAEAHTQAPAGGSDADEHSREEREHEERERDGGRDQT